MWAEELKKLGLSQSDVLLLRASNGKQTVAACEEWHANRQVQDRDRELERAKSEITKMKMANERSVQQLMEKSRNQQCEIELLRGRASTAELLARGIQHVPDQLYVTQSGDCFHTANCPALQHAHQARPTRTLAKCKRCF